MSTRGTMGGPTEAPRRAASTMRELIRTDTRPHVTERIGTGERWLTRRRCMTGGTLVSFFAVLGREAHSRAHSCRGDECQTDTATLHSRPADFHLLQAPERPESARDVRPDADKVGRHVADVLRSVLSSRRCPRCRASVLTYVLDIRREDLMARAVVTRDCSFQTNYPLVVNIACIATLSPFTPSTDWLRRANSAGMIAFPAASKTARLRPRWLIAQCREISA